MTPFCDGLIISAISLARNLARNVARTVVRNATRKVARNVVRNLGRIVCEDEKRQCLFCKYIHGMFFWDDYFVLQGTKL